MKQSEISPHHDSSPAEFLQTPQVVAHLLRDDGTHPNNERLPLVVYQGALKLPERNPASIIEALLRENQWDNSWRNGIYGIHHYHSTAHEVLCVYSGTARVQFGGEEGPILEVGRGDVVIIPAGVAHKNLGSSRDFRCVGAYPRGQSPDMNYGQPGERPRADQNIAQVPLPQADPVHGTGGPLLAHWPIAG
jgi:uncharacterized protein YjlB